MVSDAQKRANSAYRKKSVKQIVMRFYPNETDEIVYKWLKGKKNINTYLKSLVLEDIARSSDE